MASNLEAMTIGTPVNNKVGPKQFQGLVEVMTIQVALTDTTIAAQVSSQGTFTATGVKLGDIVLVGTNSDVGALLIQAAVSATDTIKVTAFNTQGTDADTSLAGGAVANLLVLRPKTNWAQN